MKYSKLEELWIKCQVKSKKRPVTATAGGGATGGPKPKRFGSVYDSSLQKMHKVDVIMAKLEEKHKNRYSKEQIRCWEIWLSSTNRMKCLLINLSSQLKLKTSLVLLPPFLLEKIFTF
jgi:hypothetical protein